MCIGDNTSLKKPSLAKPQTALGKNTGQTNKQTDRQHFYV